MYQRMGEKGREGVGVKGIEINRPKMISIPAYWRRGHALTACNAAPPAKSKMAARGPENGRRGLEKCLPIGFWVF